MRDKKIKIIGINNGFFNNVKEIQKNKDLFFTNSLRNNFQNKINLGVGGIVKQIKEHQETLKKALKTTIQEGIKAAADDVEKFKFLVLEFGFPPHYDLNIKQMRLIVKYYNENGKEKTDQLLTDFFVKLYSSEQMERFLENWEKIEWLNSRINILKEVIDCHKEGKYFSSVATLLPQIEGVIVYGNNASGFMSQKDIRNLVETSLNEETSFSLDDTVRLFYINVLQAGFEHGKVKKSFLSRHAILHGGDLEYGNELNSIRCIVLFDYLVNKFNESE